MGSTTSTATEGTAHTELHRVAFLERALSQHPFPVIANLPPLQVLTFPIELSLSTHVWNCFPFTSLLYT
jgi:hypothetical protein